MRGDRSGLQAPWRPPRYVRVKANELLTPHSSLLTPYVLIRAVPRRPPKAWRSCASRRRQLAQLNPAFFSVTFGAGGSTRDRTLGVALEIQAEGQQVAPHISCVASTKASLREMLQRYRDAGIKRIVALRGDLPSGMADAGEFRYANELVAFVRTEFGAAFHIEVACYPEYHPQARTAQEDLVNFSVKWTQVPTQRLRSTLQPGRTRLRGGMRGGWHCHPDRARHHADRPVCAARALLGCVRRRGPPVDPSQARRLWRRHGIDPLVRVGRRDQPLTGSCAVAHPGCTSTHSTRQVPRDHLATPRSAMTMRDAGKR